MIHFVGMIPESRHFLRLQFVTFGLEWGVSGCFFSLKVLNFDRCMFVTV